MKDYITLGSTPLDEKCIQVNPSENYFHDMRTECNRYMNMLYDRFPGLLEKGASLGVKTFNHDFGRYCEVVLWYDDENETAIDAVFHVQDHLPLLWSDKAIITIPDFEPEEEEEENYDPECNFCHGVKQVPVHTIAGIMIDNCPNCNVKYSKV